MEQPNVPEDVITEILVRISAIQLLKFRIVCRRWKDLMSAQYFQNKHLIRSKECDTPFPMILAKISGNKVLIFEKSEKGEKQMFVEDVPKFKDDNLRFDTMTIKCSYDGFLVMKQLDEDFAYTIYNPVTGETVMINSSIIRPKFSILALYFNPWINEYCVILAKEGSQSYYDSFEMLNLGCRPYRCKPLKQPNSERMKSYCPELDCPVVINNANIYWSLYYSGCEELILAFNIKDEEFSFLPHPHLHRQPCSVEVCCQWLSNTHITDIKGCLTYVQITHIGSEVIFNAWSWTTAAPTQQQRQEQEQQEEESSDWIKILSVVINADEFDFESDFEVLMIGNGEMLFVKRSEFYALIGDVDWKNEARIIFAYNFQLRTLRRVSKFEYGSFFSYVPSFVSLNNSDSKTCI